MNFISQDARQNPVLRTHCGHIAAVLDCRIDPETNLQPSKPNVVNGPLLLTIKERHRNQSVLISRHHANRDKSCRPSEYSDLIQSHSRAYASDMPLACSARITKLSADSPSHGSVTTGNGTCRLFCIWIGAECVFTSSPLVCQPKVRLPQNWCVCINSNEYCLHNQTSKMPQIATSGDMGGLLTR